MVIPDEYKYTVGGNLQLQFDSGEQDPQRMLIFALEETLDALMHTPHILTDASFDVNVENIWNY